jgi:hypothetical protein
MATGMLHTHYLFVVLFTIIYLVKTILLLSDKDELLEKFKKKTKDCRNDCKLWLFSDGYFLANSSSQ